MGKEEKSQEIQQIWSAFRWVPYGKSLLRVFYRMTRPDLVEIHPDWTDTANKGLVAPAYIKELNIFDPTLLTCALVTDWQTVRFRLWLSEEGLDSFLHIPLEQVWDLDYQAVPGTLVMAVAAIFNNQGRIINYSREDVPFHHNVGTICNPAYSHLSSEDPVSKIPSYFRYLIKEEIAEKGAKFSKPSRFLKRAGYGMSLGS